MHPVIALALVMVAGVAAIRLPRFPALPPAFAVFGAAGTALIVLGVLLGPWSGVLDDATLGALLPLLALGTGWVGARYGVRLQARWLRRVPRDVWLLAIVQAVASAAAVLLVLIVALLAIPSLRNAWPAPRAATLLALAAIAAISGPDIVTIVARQSGLRPHTLRRLRAAATLDAAFGVLLFAAVLGGRRFGLLGGLPVALALGAIVGVLVAGLHRLLDADDLTVTMLGACLLGAGAGIAAGVPPFLVCAVAAAGVTRLSPHRVALARRFVTWERPMLGVMLLLTGALLRLPFTWIIPIALAGGIVRGTARWAAVRYGGTLVRRFGAIDRDAGLAGIAQGSVPIALAVGWHTGRPGVASATVLAIVVLGTLAAQLAAPWCMARATRPREL